MTKSQKVWILSKDYGPQDAGRVPPFIVFTDEQEATEALQFLAAVGGDSYSISDGAMWEGSFSGLMPALRCPTESDT
jgi:hypothetical protein